MWLLKGRGAVMERDTHTKGGREGGKEERDGMGRKRKGHIP